MYNTILKISKKNGSEGRTRTCDNLINSQVLLPTELLRNNTIQIGLDNLLSTFLIIASILNNATYFVKNIIFFVETFLSILWKA